MILNRPPCQRAFCCIALVSTVVTAVTDVLATPKPPVHVDVNSAGSCTDALTRMPTNSVPSHEELLRLTVTDLEALIARRLQAVPITLLALNTIVGESPHEPLVKRFSTMPTDFSFRLNQAITNLIVSMREKPWSPDSFNSFSLLLEELKLTAAVPALEALARDDRLLTQDHGHQLRMLVLRTLLSLGWKGDLDYWNSQIAVLPPRWHNVVFDGLFHINPKEAFEKLPVLAGTPEAMRGILAIFPGLRDEGLDPYSMLLERLDAYRQTLKPSAMSTMEEWLRVRRLAGH